MSLLSGFTDWHLRYSLSHSKNDAMFAQGMYSLLENSGTDFAIRLTLLHILFDFALITASSIWLVARIAIIAMATLFVMQMHVRAGELTDVKIVNKFFGQYVWALLLRCMPLILKPRLIWSAEEARAAKWPRRLLAATKGLWDYRGIGTDKVIDRIPPFSWKDANWVPSRGRFLFGHACSFVLSVLILKITLATPPPFDVEDFSAVKEHLFSRLSEVTAREFLRRTIFTISQWTIAFLFINLMYDIPALICVGTGVSSPASWPPMWGPISEAYSIRNFWGVVWHQTMRTLLRDNADIIANQILRIPKGTLISRYAKLTLAFWISGLWHFTGDFNVPNAENGTVGFFLLHAGAIMLEDAAKELYRWSGWRLPAVWERRIGYLWFAFFMIWSTPRWGYPKMRYAFQS